VEYLAKVVVAGGGIGGLTAAIALRRAGFEVSVFERAAELGEVGAGLLLAANAQKALAKLGLADAVARLGTPASAGEIRSWRGEVLASIPAAELEKKVGTPSAAFHRLTCKPCSWERWRSALCALAQRWKASSRTKAV
jgi:2-polyprenyl-6-methoxyphenol hydroxylase-like FAD-dependent oxidoreductase